MQHCKTRVKLLEEIEHGCRDIEKIKPHNLIDLCISYIEEYESKNKIYKVMKDFMLIKDENLSSLYDLQCETAKAILHENYDFLDNLFDEVHEGYMAEVDGLKYYYPDDRGR